MRIVNHPSKSVPPLIIVMDDANPSSVKVLILIQCSLEFKMDLNGKSLKLKRMTTILVQASQYVERISTSLLTWCMVPLI
jgi:hypothetical protein